MNERSFVDRFTKINQEVAGSLANARACGYHELKGMFMKHKKNAKSAKSRSVISKRSRRSTRAQKTIEALNFNPSPRRVRELKFASEHPEIFGPLAGKWVVLEGEAIVAHGADPATVVAKARKSGIAVPFIFKVEAPLRTNEGTLGL
jgi:hypothetical protein